MNFDCFKKLKKIFWSNLSNDVQSGFFFEFKKIVFDFESINRIIKKSLIFEINNKFDSNLIKLWLSFLEFFRIF